MKPYEAQRSPVNFLLGIFGPGNPGSLMGTNLDRTIPHPSPGKKSPVNRRLIAHRVLNRMRHSGHRRLPTGDSTAVRSCCLLGTRKRSARIALRGTLLGITPGFWKISLSSGFFAMKMDSLALSDRVRSVNAVFPVRNKRARRG